MKQPAFAFLGCALLWFSACTFSPKADFVYSSANHREEPVVVPLQRMNSGHISLKVKLNGIKGLFLLDTGAAFTVLEASRKKTFEVQDRPTPRTATGAGCNELPLTLSSDNLLQLGALRIGDQDLTLMSLAHVNQSFQEGGMKPIDGVIGADILREFRAVIDYGEMVLRLHKR